MAANLSPCHAADEDYIDMELSSSPNLFCLPDKTSPQSREFEFQMSSFTCNGRESTTSPADELFYKGKLLPLYLPPRLQMVQTLLRSSTNPVFEAAAKEAPEEDEDADADDERCGIPFITISTAPSTNISTPLGSCNISPSESRRVSCELTPAEYYFEWSTEFSSFIDTHPKKSWSKKLKMIKHSTLTQKLKASRAYLKSMFSKPVCSDESCAKESRNSEAEKEQPKAKDFSSKYINVVSKKTPFGHVGRRPYPTIANLIKSIDKEEQHRRSFSGAIKRHSPSKCLSSSSSSSSNSSSSGASSSSSSFSINSNTLYESHSSLKRSSSDVSDIEISIQSAIAHCKNSQVAFISGNPLSEARVC